MRKLIIWVCVGMLGLAPTVHLFTAEPSTMDVKVEKERGMRVVKSDAEVSKAVKDAFAADKDLANFVSTIDVKAEAGVVTLSGTVDKEKTKSDLEAKAKSVDGVKSVVNKIEVKATVMK